MSTLRDETKQPQKDITRLFARENPPFFRAVLMDAQLFSLSRSEEPRQFRSKWEAAWRILRLCWVADAFLSLLLHRMKVSFRARNIPILPMIAHKLSIILAQVHIGAPVVIKGGIYLPHGQVVIDGITTIGPGARIRPFVTIGLKEGDVLGPSIGANVMIGTGAKIIGPITIGDGARIGAGAVVVDNVPAGATVAGVPARIKETTANANDQTKKGA